MDNQPKRLITRILEFAGLFALSAYLLRLGVAYLREIWVPLLIISAAIVFGAFAYRVWRRDNWY